MKVNVKKLQFIHMLTSYDDVQRYSNITFIFAVLDARTSVAVNMCINCSFLH